MTVRAVTEEDFNSIQPLDYMLWLSIQWNGSYHREDAFIALDEQGFTKGVIALAWDATMYYLERTDVKLPRYRLQMEYAIDKNADAPEAVAKMLLETEQNHLKKLQQSYPGKTLCMRCWCYDDEKTKMQFLLENGFYVGDVVMVLKYDLRTKIACAPYRQDIVVEQMPKEEAFIEQYLQANELGYDGVQDSADEFRFRLQGENTEVFIARVGDRIVSSCTIWQITPERYATENVFTIPKYRRMGYGKAVLSVALQRIRELGGLEATLTVVGDNRTAIAMYMKLGYTIRQNMLEMHYIAE